MKAELRWVGQPTKDLDIRLEGKKLKHETSLYAWVESMEWFAGQQHGDGNSREYKLGQIHAGK